jgi:hypothetical protein
MGSEKTVIRGKMEVAGIMGPIWAMGWLFTAGYLHLPIGKIILGILLWPYYLGSMLGR